MSLNNDLTDLFKAWPFEDSKNIRFITANDGREVMQVRLPMGIEQYELEGRPDGKKPDGFNSYLEKYIDLYEKSLNENTQFSLNDDDYALLREEGILVYSRYIVLFQINDFKRTAKDTDHNLGICKLVESGYKNEDKDLLLQYKPYIIRINAISKAMLDLKEGMNLSAKVRVEKALEEITNMAKVDTPVFDFEILRSKQHLNKILEQVEQRPLTEKDILEAELHRAVENEEYERAAKLRDQLKNL